MKTLAAAAILNYNRPDLEQMMIDQLTGCRHIYSIDNGSKQESNPVTLYPIQKVKLSHNLLFTGGWNAAMKYSDLKNFDWVWMLNSDLIGCTNAMLLGLQQAVEQLDYSKILAVTPSFNSPHPHHWGNLGGKTFDKLDWVDWCCPLVNVALWRELGGFDPLFKGYGADLDLAKRAQNKGYEMYVCNRFRVDHLGSQTSISEGANGINDVDEMNRLLKVKWNINDWTQLF